MLDASLFCILTTDTSEAMYEYIQLSGQGRLECQRFSKISADRAVAKTLANP
jgi:hypothetical protein